MPVAVYGNLEARIRQNPKPLGYILVGASRGRVYEKWAENGYQLIIQVIVSAKARFVACHSATVFGAQSCVKQSKQGKCRAYQVYDQWTEQNSLKLGGGTVVDMWKKQRSGYMLKIDLPPEYTTGGRTGTRKKKKYPKSMYNALKGTPPRTVYEWFHKAKALDFDKLGIHGRACFPS